MNLIDFEVPTQNLKLQPSTRVKSSKVNLLCCIIHRSSNLFNKNGLSIYMNFLNENIKQNQLQRKRVSNKTPFHSDSTENIRSNPSIINTTPTTTTNNNRNVYSTPVYVGCKGNYCTLEAIPRNMGYCYECFKKSEYFNNKKMDMASGTNLSNVSNEGVIKVENSKKQDNDLIRERMVSLDNSEKRNEKIEKVEQKPVMNSNYEINAELRKRPMTAAHLNVCATENCHDVAVSSIFSDVSNKFCKNCQIALKSQENLARRTGIELPIKFESSGPSRRSYNTVSAYNDNLMPKSKLYNTSLLQNSGGVNSRHFSAYDSFNNDNTQLNKMKYNSNEYSMPSNGYTRATRLLCRNCRQLFDISINSQSHPLYCKNCQ